MHNASSQSHRKLRAGKSNFDVSATISSDRPLTSNRHNTSSVAARMFKGVPSKGASPSPRMQMRVNPLEHVDAFLQNYEHLPRLMGSSREVTGL
jgi:hypothetical protein